MACSTCQGQLALTIIMLQEVLLAVLCGSVWVITPQEHRIQAHL
jgi:hypothetical protein